MQIFVKCFVVLVFLTCFVQQIHSEIKNISENAFKSELFPSSILYGLSVLAIQSTSADSISSCVQQLIAILEAAKTKQIWALKSEKNYD